MSGSYNWIASGTGDWDVAANWDPQQVPTRGSQVVVYGDVTHDQAIRDSVQNLEFDGFQLEVGAGTLQAHAVEISESDVLVNGGNLVLQTLTQIADDMNIDVEGGAMTIGHGTIDLWPNQAITVGSGGSLTLNSIIVTDDDFVSNGPFGSIESKFVNGGTLIVNGKTDIVTEFANNGVVHVDGGTFEIAGTATDSGSYAGDGTLRLGAFILGYHTTFADATRTIAGPVDVSHVIEDGSVVTFGGAFQATTTEASINAYEYFDGEFSLHYSGSMTFDAGYQSANTRVDPAGVMIFNDAATTGTLSMRGGEFGDANEGIAFQYIDGTIVANSAFAVTGAATLHGATFAGSGKITLGGATAVAADLNLQGSGLVFENQGTLSFIGAHNVVHFEDTPTTSSLLKNDTGAVIDDQVDMNFGGNYSGSFLASTIDNEGLFKKSGGHGTTEIDVAFTNGGTIEVDSGTLWLKGGLSGAGNVVLNGGTLLIGPDGTPYVPAVAGVDPFWGHHA